MSKKKTPTIFSKERLEAGLPLHFKRGTSKGRDTYGYTIVSLYIDGEKVSSCQGGGYDMQGTALADWMEFQFSEELKTLEPFHRIGEGDNERQVGFYGLFVHVKGDNKYQPKWMEGAKLHLDGGCGFSSMESIIKALGYRLRYLREGRKDSGRYILEPVKVEA